MCLCVSAPIERKHTSFSRFRIEIRTIETISTDDREMKGASFPVSVCVLSR